ncbi:MAG: hypothetical protein JWM11_819 [Planctomycetaceae bacterium]|nr:hypothetical protein [Planctomycetaceae bacterium]
MTRESESISVDPCPVDFELLVFHTRRVLRPWNLATSRDKTARV